MTVIAFEISEEQRRNYTGPSNSLACWAWTIEQFGVPGTRWTWDTYKRFWFYNEKDAVLFALKWV